MTAAIITAQTKSIKFLEKSYPHEMAACLPHIIPIAQTTLGDLTLTTHQRALQCVRIAHGVHWVMQRDDGTYMDPAGGATAFSITQAGPTVRIALP